MSASRQPIIVDTQSLMLLHMFAYVKLKPYSTKIHIFRQSRALRMARNSLFCKEVGGRAGEVRGWRTRDNTLPALRQAAKTILDRDFRATYTTYTTYGVVYSSPHPHPPAFRRGGCRT